MNSFYQLLNTLTVNRLKSRLSFLSKGLKPTRKSEIIEYIYNDCLQNHRHYWDQLSEIEQKAVSEALYSEEVDGQLSFNAYQFNAKYNDMPDYFKRNSFYYDPHESYLLLFFYDGAVPAIYKEWMKDYVKKPKAISIATIDEEQLPKFFTYELSDWEQQQGFPDKVAIKQLDTEEMVSRDLESMLHFVETGQCAVSDKTNRASAATIRKLDKLLLGGDYFLPEDEWENIQDWYGSPVYPIRSFAWPLLLQASGLAKRTGKKLHLSNAGKKALSAPLHNTVKTLYQRWRNKGLIDEFSRIDEIKGQAGKGRVMTAIAPRKKAIEDYLKQCPVNEWIGIDSFFTYIKSTGITFGITHDEWRLYIADKEYGALGYDGFGIFEVLEGRYIMAYFFEYLATIGVLDITYTVPYFARGDYRQIWGTDDLIHLSRYDGLLYFRINPLGAYCLGMAKSYQPKVIKKAALLKVDCDLSLQLLRQASPSELMLLTRYTTKISDTHWQLTEEKMLSAIEENFSSDSFLTFLQESSEQSDLDDLIQGFFTTINEKENALEDMGAARMLHCYSKGFANMLANHAKTKKYCLHAGGNVIIIPEKTKKQFVAGLRKLGYVYPQEQG